MSDKKDKACWYDDVELPQKMLDGASGKLWAPLDQSDHWPMLAYLLEACKINYPCRTVLDVGCGAAALSEHIEMEYTGCDLEHIIDKVAKVRNPKNNYIKFDINDDDLSFVGNYDIVVMNAFIDVLENPMEALDKILSNAKKFVICHRQKLGSVTKIEKVKSYSGFSWGTTLGVQEVKDCLQKHGFRTLVSYPTMGQYHSFLLVKDEVR